jgi:hypothetical protein
MLYYIEKPVAVSSLSSAILVALNMRDENTKGYIPLNRFLPLVELEGKTCRLEVQSSGNRKSYLYFDKGLLIDAHYGGLTPEAVVKEALNWKNIHFRFSEFPARRGHKRLNTPIMDLVSATWEKHRVIKENNLPQKNKFEPNVPCIKETTEKLLSQLAKRFNSIKGYKGIAVLDKNFNLLASDQLEQQLDLKKFFRDINLLYNNMLYLFMKNGWDRCKMVVFHTSSGIIHILDMFELSVKPLYLTSVTESENNWLLMKSELEHFERQLRKKLA